MSEALGDRVSIVGIGESGYGKRGAFSDTGEVRLAAAAVRAACADAGISPQDIDGFSGYCDDRAIPYLLAPELGLTTWSYSAMAWGGGGSGLLTALTNAAMAITSGVAHTVVVLRSIVQSTRRMGSGLGGSRRDRPVEAPDSYFVPFGMLPPMALYAMRAQRHMALYGTTSQHLAAVAIQQRAYAARNPMAVYREPLSVDQHRAARIVAAPLRLFDCCMESDGAAAIVVTSRERSSEFARPAVHVRALDTRTPYRWSSPLTFTEPDAALATSMHAEAAARVWKAAGLGPGDIDVAGFYDGSTISPILALEDWGFCERGEGGPFVADGQTALTGALPLNTSGGNLSEAYQQGLNHLIELVRQLRGTSHNQVPGAEVAMYSAGLSYAPMGGVVITR